MFNTIRTSEDTSLEKYTNHFIWKGCVWEGVGGWAELQHIDPYSYSYNSVSFPFWWAAQPGSCGGGLPLWEMFLIPASTPTDLNFLSPGLYNNLTSTLLPASVTISHSRSRSYPDIPRTDAPLTYTGAFPILTAWPGRRSIYNTYCLMTTFSSLHIIIYTKFHVHFLKYGFSIFTRVFTCPSWRAWCDTSPFLSGV